MSSAAVRSYFTLMMDDGTLTLCCIRNKDVDPRVSITDQLNRCIWMDNMSINEGQELGAGLINAAVGASRKYAERVRTMKIRGLVANAAIEPMDDHERAKWATFLEGVNLDPAAMPGDIQNALNKKEQDDIAAEQEAMQERPLDDQ